MAKRKMKKIKRVKSREEKRISRRKFLVRSSVGVGVLLGAGYLSRNVARRYIAEYANSAELPYGGTAPLNTWFEITADNQIILHSPKVEMGQGTHTGLAQIAADELEVPVEMIRVVHAASESGNVDPFSTGGSTSISGLFQPLRELSATMREMLKNEAARLINADVSELSVIEGVISHGSESMTYGEIIAQVEEWTVPEVPVLKAVSDYKYVGQPVPRIDLHEKVTGAPIFGMDVSMPGMLFGAVVRSEKIGAKFKSADVSAAEGMPGVVAIVEESDFVGVVAETRMHAELAKRAIKAEWEVEKNWQLSDIEAMIKVGEGEAFVIQTKGEADDILDEDAEGINSAEFTTPIGAHAQIEPNGALAFVDGDSAEIHISTQVIGATQASVANRLGLEKENVNVQATFLGGGFGRRLDTSHAIYAALMSKAVGKPVKYFFDRKEEFQHDTFRPPTHHVLKGKLSPDGMIEAIEHNVSSGDVMFGSALVPGFVAPILGADIGAWRGGMIQYRGIPNHRAISWRVKLPFATSFWRSLGLLANTFAIESFIDELALKAGKNPVQFRLDHIQDDEAGKRLAEVIRVAGQKARYRDEVMDGKAMGFAASTDAGTPCAHVAEVSIEGKEIKVHKVTCVIDPGYAVNPDQVKAQCEGSIIMGLSASLYEKMTVKNGSLYPTIYGPYKMALMKHAPKEIDTVIINSSEKPGPVGEPPLGPIGAAIANAVFRLNGQRLRNLPLELS